ncbi:ICEBs1 excisionase [Alkalicoccobacillus gibsonii]|uniref:ICEBs1 excisionase n=1 Tax=Alkalicoccobacillus gibsonii TaxID=79881 RepID=UPI001933A4C8|nr:ICEBs1 excisionase [Alkalicoccobacillus gibsonii]MBM0066746.1 ICEBs1 excisionase [Alkalicoccobacillus gibsonii]
MSEFLTPKDVQEILHVKEAKAYEVIRQLNRELKQEGYMVIRGKVSKSKFEERYVYKGKVG